jgi:hypothetical protein
MAPSGSGLCFQILDGFAGDPAPVDEEPAFSALEQDAVVVMAVDDHLDAVGHVGPDA